MNQIKLQAITPILRVKGFSCLKDVEITFKRITLFIGEQGTGKSVTCKLYYFFTEAIRKVATICLRDELLAKDFVAKLQNEFRIIFPESAWKHDSFEIEWRSENVTVRISHKVDNKRLKIDFDQFVNLYAKSLEAVKDFKNSKAYREQSRYGFEADYALDRYVRGVVDKFFPCTSVDYIPAGRSFFSTIQDTVFTLLSNNIGIDYFLKEFGQRFESFRFHFYRMGRRFADPLLRKILHGTYVYDGKEQWIETDAYHKVRLADASSGQQEALPLLMMLMSSKAPIENRGRCVLIEEPEAHLYPTAQEMIVDHIGNILRRSNNLRVMITTHSPFILCCINNLLTRNEDMFKDNVSAYHLNNGESESIFDEDYCMINASRYDAVSFKISNEVGGD